jgi:type IV pilus assembly protein PilN
LRTVVQRGLKASLAGYAQSNARVSTLMRNVEASPFLENPELIEVRAANIDRKRVSQFNMNISLKRSTTEAKDAGKGAPKPAAKKG